MSIKGFEVGGVQQQYDYTALDNIPANLVQDANYVHTDNNYTNADKTKLSGIEAQANKTTIDATLTHSGQAADAKATGDAISALDAQVIASMPHDTASGAIASFPDGAAMPVRDLSVAIEPVQAGSGDPSPDNVRPISGHTDADVTRTGKNLVSTQPVLTTNTLQTIVDFGRDVTISCVLSFDADNITFQSSAAALFDFKKEDGTHQYRTPSNFTRVSDNQQMSIATQPINGKFTCAASNITFRYLNCFFMSASYGLYTGALKNVQLELGSTASDYEEYRGTTYPIPLGQTVYGGTLDVTTGKLTVNRAMVDMGALSWNGWETDGVYIFYATISGKVQSRASVCISSQYVYNKDVYAWTDLLNAQMTGANGNANIYIEDNRYSSISDFSTAMDGVQLVYELATPIEVDLTPTEITTLLGTNNIWADAGDTTVNYYADTTLFVNKKIAAAVAAMS